ncbi:HAMP domain-containing sensor histidine kinase [Tissierella praeacuta]|uniref:sensor histidine kinase n=1 Tax=Tissierella praeacuta TaxID=43131 RepID=UPI0033409954
MKFHRSITLQVFFTILPIFLLVLILQMIFFGKYLAPIYSNNLIRNMHNELSDVAEKFSSGNMENNNSVLRAYTIEHEAPVLVLREDYRIADWELFNYLSILTVKAPDIGVCRIPISGLYELSKIPFTEKLTIEAVRLGDSTYYKAFSIRSAQKTYFYQSYSDYLNENPTDLKNRIEMFAVSRNWYTKSDGSLTSDRARIIYDLMKECLINRTNIEKRLEAITKEPFTDNRGTTYCVIAESRQIDGVMTYFVTIRPIVLSENEANYFIKYFYIVFSILGILLTAAVYILSRRLSAPIVKLSSVTSKLASQDFSVRADIGLLNEVGKLSASINLMADNLQAAITELKQSADVAHMNEERMKRLLADLAHEFKTPLGIISLYTEVIEKGMYEKEPAHYFGIIEHEIESLTRMIDETIQLTKLQAGYWEYRPAPVYLNDLIEVALSKFSEELARENFMLEVSMPDVMVMADGRRIEQVLTNLISNAVKYSGAIKLIEVEVTLDKGTVTVSISNYGHISEQDLNYIWDRYYRTAENTSARLPSEGIGLEIVRYILLMHQSDFGVRQEVDKICFYFTLQLVDK